MHFKRYLKPTARVTWFLSPSEGIGLVMLADQVPGSQANTDKCRAGTRLAARCVRIVNAGIRVINVLSVQTLLNACNFLPALISLILSHVLSA